MLRIRAARHLAVVQQRCYAKVVKAGKEKTEDERRVNAKTGRDEREVMDSMKDFLRKAPTKWRKPNTPLQFKQESYLADNYSQHLFRIRQKLRKEAMLKMKLMQEALDSLPEELRREAAKTDWDLIPEEMPNIQSRFPLQYGYNPPLEILKNEL
jgi:exonuclease VII large subunit